MTIASLPLNQLNSNVTSLQNQGDELATLQTGFAALQTAIQNLDQTTNGGNLTASVSDNTVATATLNSTTAVAGGTYVLNVTSPGSPTTTVSNSGLPSVADPTSSSISTASSFTLSVAGTNFTITPASNTLSSLVQAINSSGADLSATLVNSDLLQLPTTGFRSKVRHWELWRSSSTTGPTGFIDDCSTTGTAAQYQVNGQPSTPISSDSSTVHARARPYGGSAQGGPDHHLGSAQFDGRLRRHFRLRIRLQRDRGGTEQEPRDSGRGVNRTKHCVFTGAIAAGCIELLQAAAAPCKT